MDEGLLRKLFERDERWYSNVEEFRDAYASYIPKDHDIDDEWSRLFDDWYEAQREIFWSEADIEHAPDLYCETWVLDRIADEIEVVPHLEIVRKKLSLAAAQHYRAVLENLENKYWQLDCRKRMLDADGSTWKKKRITRILDLCDVLNSSDVPAAFQELQDREKRARSRKRARIRAQNEDVIRRAQKLDIWFPFDTDMDPKRQGKWCSHPCYEELKELVKETRERMREERCLRQYIPKRRCTKQNTEDLQRNMDQMRMYLDDCI